MYMKLKFEYTAKWYLYKLETLPENNTRIIFWALKIRTGYQISAEKTDIEMINKIRGLCHPSASQRENQRKWKERSIHGLYERTKKSVEHEGDGNISSDCGA